MKHFLKVKKPKMMKKTKRSHKRKGWPEKIGLAAKKKEAKGGGWKRKAKAAQKRRRPC